MKAQMESWQDIQEYVKNNKKNINVEWLTMQ